MKNKVTIHHTLADIHIVPSKDAKGKALCQIIRGALDTYLEEQHIPAKKLHEDMKSHHGEYYRTPGYYVRLYRNREGLTQDALSKKLAMMQHHISEIEHNKRPIGKTLARRIAKTLHCDYRKFL